MSEDLFDEIIEYVGEMSDDEKKGTECGMPLIRKRPTQQQYTLIQDFLDKDIGRKRFEDNDELWTHLTAKLNGIGPPAYSNVEWRRKWSVYEYKTKMLTSSKQKNRKSAAAQSKGTNGANPRNTRADFGTGRTDTSAASTSGAFKHSNETGITFTRQSDETGNTFTQSNEMSDSDSKSMSEEFLDECMEFENLNADKENQPNNPDTIKKPRVSKQQYTKMDRFHKEHSEALVEGANYNKLWNDLALELNDMGPCVQSVQEWKRKWALRKFYHKKRSNSLVNTKILDHEPSSSDESNKVSCGHSRRFENEVLKKLDQIIDKLNELIEAIRTQSAPSASGNE